MGTGWLFMERGALLELNWVCWVCCACGGRCQGGEVDWLFLLQFPVRLPLCWADPWTLLTFFDQLTASMADVISWFQL